MNNDLKFRTFAHPCDKEAKCSTNFKLKYKVSLQVYFLRKTRIDAQVCPNISHSERAELLKQT